MLHSLEQVVVVTTVPTHPFEADLHAEMERAVASPVQLLQDMLSFQIGGDSTSIRQTRTARLRGMLCLIVCDALSGDHPRALPVAVAIELAYQHFLVHQAIGVTGNQIAGDHTRIEGRWGSGQAINAGDGLHALARLAITRLSDHGCDDETVLVALRSLDEACAQTCEGAHMDLVAEDDTQSVEAFVTAAELKTGSLMGCAARLGSLVAGSDSETQESFQNCGSQLGVALEMREYASTSQGDAQGLVAIARNKMDQAREGFALLGIENSKLVLLERLAGGG